MLRSATPRSSAASLVVRYPSTPNRVGVTLTQVSWVKGGGLRWHRDVERTADAADAARPRSPSNFVWCGGRRVASYARVIAVAPASPSTTSNGGNEGRRRRPAGVPFLTAEGGRTSRGCADRTMTDSVGLPALGARSRAARTRATRWGTATRICHGSERRGTLARPSC
jgi:hypothetical protein